MIGTFRLSKGEIIQILVGQEGGINWASRSSGGGGGTFVVRGSNTSLIIAGGGGGVQRPYSRHAGCDASTSTTGNPGYRSWSGGSNGHGAQATDAGDSGNNILCDQFYFCKMAADTIRLFRIENYFHAYCYSVLIIQVCALNIS